MEEQEEAIATSASSSQASAAASVCGPGRCTCAGRSVRGRRRERRVVDVESLRDAGFGPQHVGRNERRRSRSPPPGTCAASVGVPGPSVKPRLSRTLCSKGSCPVNIERATAASAARARTRGRRRPRRCASAVEHRGAACRVAVDRQPIGAQRVDDDEDHRPGRRLMPCRRTRTSQPEADGQQDEDDRGASSRPFVATADACSFPAAERGARVAAIQAELAAGETRD